MSFFRRLHSDRAQEPHVVVVKGLDSGADVCTHEPPARELCLQPGLTAASAFLNSCMHDSENASYVSDRINRDIIRVDHRRSADQMLG